MRLCRNWKLNKKQFFSFERGLNGFLFNPCFCLVEQTYSKDKWNNKVKYMMGEVEKRVVGES